MTSKKVINLVSDDLEKSLGFVSALVNEQRASNMKNIEKLHKEHKKHLHSSEYKLIFNLFKGLENSLKLEYLNYLNTQDADTYFLFDAWGMDKLVNIYSKI